MSGTQAQDTLVGDKVDSAVSDLLVDTPEVADLLSRVTNVSLDKEGEPETSASTEMVSSNFTPLPRRDILPRNTRAKSVTSFLSCPSTPDASSIAVTKSVRPINSYFTPIEKPNPSVDGKA